MAKKKLDEIVPVTFRVSTQYGVQGEGFLPKELVGAFVKAGVIDEVRKESETAPNVNSEEDSDGRATVEEDNPGE